MQINISSPDRRKGSVACEDNNRIKEISGDISLDEIAEDLKSVKPSSALGIVNTTDAEVQFILRSLETVGWSIDWPEVEPGDEHPDDNEKPSELIVN
ncbi:hypothetical protein [Atlantibacter hermannii]|uniref:hypothetical protein n=1 Tax=Atlantibacter hermannii TaxID=565 RepID=UPI00289A7DC2|nr:hypothetical protein [Atlantibacter hermannii]